MRPILQDVGVVMTAGAPTLSVNGIELLGRELSKFPGVTGVWLHEVADDEAAVYVTVEGLDAPAIKDRLRVYKRLGEYVEEHRAEMEQAGFVFNYSVLLDDAEIVEPSIPAGAKHIDAA